MKVMVLLATSALLAAPSRIELPVVVKSVRSSCRSPKPGKPSLEWSGDNIALVRATVDLGSWVSVPAESAHAYLEGNQLKICYNTNIVPHDPHAPVSMCPPPTNLEFTVSEIPQGNYEVRVFSCAMPHVLYYVCVKDGKKSFTIYETPGCTPVLSDAP